MNLTRYSPSWTIDSLDGYGRRDRHPEGKTLYKFPEQQSQVQYLDQPLPLFSHELVYHPYSATMRSIIPSIVASVFFAAALAIPAESGNPAAALEASKALTAGLPTSEPANFLANSTEDGLSKRALTHLYVCTDIDFEGTCQNLLTSTGYCCQLKDTKEAQSHKLITVILDNLGNGFRDTISSLGPDEGTSCTVFQ